MRRTSSRVAGGDLLGRVGQLEVVELSRLGEPLEVVGVPEDRRAALGLVAAHALEDAGAVVQGVAEDVDFGVLPGHELAVMPDQLCLLHVGRSMPDSARAFESSREEDHVNQKETT